ncbi:sodium-coupled monocarboxylate transporter 1-like [Athalia rosae]|uniref:sodium-coupled monocarboxylate transporter 1-like n=1 Tax=Athalia rosae TaxID=37344 RepID=UPI00203381AB|nr:sodium-coupled monocarboxylate transporter 1-like [Athalia rosae]
MRSPSKGVADRFIIFLKDGIRSSKYPGTREYSSSRRGGDPDFRFLKKKTSRLKMAVNISTVIETIDESLMHLTFGWVDYSFFTAMLSISASVGFYFGFFAKKQDTVDEYALGGKRMGAFPVAMSITASHLSTITLLGIPSEVYLFGSQYSACIVSTLIIVLVTSYIFLPVFFKLQLTSTFEYLEVRFAKSVRKLASVLYTLSTILHAPIGVYGSALALAQVTGFSFHYISPVICLICIFYTTLGGLKAVVWIDTIQFLVMVFTLLTVVILGVMSVGGFAEVWRISGEGSRLVFFDMNPSPFARMTFWGISIGLTFTWFSTFSVNQGCIQRFLATPKLSTARRAICITGVGLVLVKWLSIFTGLIIYAKYHGCDPISTGVVSKADQLIPYYVMDVTRNIPGLPGLFLAAVVSSSLSVMSNALNTTCATLWEDFISPYVPESDTKQQTATKVMRIIVVVMGGFYLSLIFLVEHMGELFSMASSLNGITAGSSIGLFGLGMLVPWANSKGAIIGGVTGFFFTAWMIVGAQIHKARDTLRYETLPVSVDECPSFMNMTDWVASTKAPIAPEDEPMTLFMISFLFYSFVGAITVLVCGTIASFATGASDLNKLNRDHFSPVVQRFLPREKYTEVPMRVIPVQITSQLDKEKEALQSDSPCRSKRDKRVKSKNEKMKKVNDADAPSQPTCYTVSSV